MKIKRKLIISLCCLGFLSIFAKFAYGAQQTVTGKICDKWYNEGTGGKSILLMPTNSIICDNPQTLAKLYNTIQNNGGMYSRQEISDNWPGCMVSNTIYLARIVKKVYAAKLAEIEYAYKTDEGNGKISCELFTNDKYNKRYALIAQLLTAKQVKQRYITTNDEQE